MRKPPIIPEIDKGNPYLNMIFIFSTISARVRLSPFGFCSFLYSFSRIKMLMSPAIRRAIVVPRIAPKVLGPTIMRMGTKTVFRMD